MTAECDPSRHLRQIRLFHDIIRFKKLGIIYEDTPEARAYSNLEDLKKVSKERGFALVECHAPDTNISEAEAVKKYLKCLETMAPVIDAFYLGAHRAANPKNMHMILPPLLKHKVPTWANRGVISVKKGALMSVGRKNFKVFGRFYANSIAKILNGAEPNSLDQVLKEDLSLAINLENSGNN